MENDPEHDESWTEISITRSRTVEQYVLFLEAEVSYIYPDWGYHDNIHLERHDYDEETTHGGW